MTDPVLIMGCGRTGGLLADMLDRAGVDVTVVDWNEGAFSHLSDSFGGRTVVGNALDQDVLRAAGIADAGSFVAATGGDNRNIMASEIAQRVFRVPRVIARIKDPDRAEFFHRLGLEVDCRTAAGAHFLLDLVDRELSEEPVQAR
jgi:trk system potassium uptake protein TrkA